MNAGLPLRVVHICKVKGIAGAERHLLSLLPALARHGVAATLLVIEERGGAAQDFCDAARRLGIPVESVATRHHIDPTLAGRIAARLRTSGADLVHTHLVHADLYGLAAARRAGIAAAVSSRHDNNPFRRRFLIRWLNGRAMRKARRVIAISHAVASFVRNVERTAAAAIVPIHYGIEVPACDDAARTRARRALDCPTGVPVIGFAGRLVHQKGVDVLLEGFSRLLPLRADARLVIAGDGPLRARLERLAGALGIAGRVTFAGWQADATAVMPAFDVMVVPSRWEGLGLVALEGLACARPLIASRVDALPELVTHAETGLLVPPGDPSALADALRDLIDNPARAARMGEAGREHVRRHFTVERMARATLDVYRDVLEEAAGSCLPSTRP